MDLCNTAYPGLFQSDSESEESEQGEELERALREKALMSMQQRGARRQSPDSESESQSD